MNNILEIPEVRQRVSGLSVADYHQMSEFNEDHKRTELIRGVLIEKMSKSPLNSHLASTLYDLLRDRLDRAWWVRKEEPITMRDSVPEPDLSVVKGRPADYIRSHPTTAALVVEIAISSPALDRENISLYAEAGVEEYWIILGREQRVEVYSHLESGQYGQKAVYSRDQILTCTPLPSASIDLADLFAAPKADT